MDSLGQKVFHHSLSIGFNETKKELARADKFGVICYTELDKQYELLLEIARYYEREYDSYYPTHDENIEYWQKIVYCVLKSLLHLQPVHPHEIDAKVAYKKSSKMPVELRQANEIYCWNVFFQMYIVFIEQLKGRRQAYPPCCIDHFIGVKQEFINVISNSSNRLSDITPSYVRLVNDVLIQKHENISADRIRALLNRSGFLTFLKFWSTNNSDVSLFFCDIDKFKQVNDCNDHAIGDGVLNDIAKIFASVSKKNNGIAARIGGEEFWLAFCNLETSLDDIYYEIKNGLKKINRPNPEKEALANGIYERYMTITSAGATLPTPENNNNEAISKWMYNLENKWMDELDKVVIVSKKSNERNCFHNVELSM